MSEFDWAKFASDALPALGNAATMLPQGIATSRLIRQNKVDNNEGYAAIQTMARNLADDEEMRTKMGERFGLTDPEEIHGKILSYFKEPDRRENNEHYVNSMGEGFNKLINEGFGDFREADVLGSVLDYTPDNIESQNIRQYHSSLVNRERNNAFETEMTTGKKQEDGTAIPFSPEERLQLRHKYNIGADENFQGEEIAEANYNEYKIQDSLSKVFDFQTAGTGTDQQRIFAMSDSEATEYLAGQGMERLDIQYFIDARKATTNEQTLEGLKLTEQRLQNAYKGAQIDKINAEIVRGNKAAADELAVGMFSTEEMISQSNKFADQAAAQQRLIATHKNSGDQIAADRAKAEYDRLRNLSNGWYTASTSVGADSGVSAQGIDEIVQNDIIESSVKNIYNEFKEMNGKPEDLYRIATENGFIAREVMTAEGQESVTMFHKDSGKRVKVNLRDGSFIDENTPDAQQAEAATTPEVEPTPLKELSVAGDPLASLKEIFTTDPSKPEGTAFTEADIALAGKANGFEMISFENGIAVMRGPDGNYLVNAETHEVKKEPSQLDYNAILNAGR